jgi:hypothetical protein
MAMFNNVLFGLLAFAIILAATAEFWLGIRYKLDSHGASARCGMSLSSIEWSAVKRAIEGADGIKLSPLDSDSRMDPFRGIYLRYGTDPEPVKQALRRWLPKHVRFLER